MRETFARGREIGLRPPLRTTAFALALVDLLIAYALRGLLTAAPARVVALVLLAADVLPTAPRADERLSRHPGLGALRLAYVRTGDHESMR